MTWAQAVDPGQAVVLTVLHFHDMGKGMGRPGVHGFKLDRRFRRRLGPGIIARFLESEGLHALEI